ncbi:MAG: tyrosine--tRNA ligase [Actinobacteria bacterium]|nr:tyrosine--tRNA ligase [Actinomycetota bacterium]
MRQDVAVPPSNPVKNELLEDLKWRGLVGQTTNDDELAADLNTGPLALYCGFDPTAASLHVGNLVPLLTLRRFQQHGHRPIALVGGATGLIGDPSGRATERTLNSDDVVADWVGRIRDQVSAFVELDGDSAATVVSNLDWTQSLTAISFLREVGKHFSVNVMLSKESVKTRLNEQGISFTEFSYMLLQAYDYLELYRRHGCRLQIGGSDQWGNITAGLDLIRKVEGGHGPRAHALTVPLVTKVDGEKFGKTAEGAIWLDGELTSPYAFYQFWLNTDDRDIAGFTKLFSMAERDAIEEVLSSHEAEPFRRSAQRFLARELTTMVHGERASEQAEAAGTALFSGGDLGQLDESTVAAALQSAPSASYSLEAPEEWPQVVDLMVATGLSESRGAARRTIKEGGAYLDNQRVTDQDSLASADQLIHNRWWVLRRGKRNFASVELRQ